MDLGTAALTPVGSGFSLKTTTGRISMDFNPVVDRLRVVSSDRDNYRINPDTGGVAATDADLEYDGSSGLGGLPFLADVAYTNNVSGAGSTTLYAYEYLNDRVVTVGSVGGSPVSPNTGRIFDVGASGVDAASASTGFDVSGVSGIAYLTLDDFTTIDTLYRVDLATGLTTSLGSTENSLLDISVAPVPEPATFAALGLGALAMLRRRKRA